MECVGDGELRYFELRYHCFVETGININPRVVTFHGCHEQPFWWCRMVITYQKKLFRRKLRIFVSSVLYIYIYFVLRVQSGKIVGKVTLTVVRT